MMHKAWLRQFSSGGMGNGKDLVDKLAARFGLKASTAKGPAKGRVTSKKQTRKRARGKVSEKQKVPRLRPAPDAAAQASQELEVGAVEESDQEHLARHKGCARTCARCKSFGLI